MKSLLVALLVAAVAFLVWREWRRSDERGADTSSHEPVLDALEKAGRTREAERVRKACAQAPRCRCIHSAGRAALDCDLHEEAAELVKTTKAECQAETEGMLGEALARARRTGEALEEATAVLRSQPDNPYALYALAFTHYVQGNPQSAWTQAELAVRHGRGSPAHLLLGLISLGQKKLNVAQAQFEKMLQSDPNDTDALYNLALIAHQRNHYREAREGYLKVLRLAPGSIAARYNLALLAHGAGAHAEAQHHLARLKEVSPPGDDRAANLERILASGGLPRSGQMAPPAPDAGIYRLQAPPSAEESNPH